MGDWSRTFFSLERAGIGRSKPLQDVRPLFEEKIQGGGGGRQWCRLNSTTALYSTGEIEIQGRGVPVVAIE